jgi:hypothetical protein
VALCALVAHAVVYQSLLPEDGAHGYFAWYAPVVVALSCISIFGFVLAIVVALGCGPESRPALLVRSILPVRPADGASASRLFRLASGAVVFLFAQESLERSLSAGRLELASFAPTTLAVLVTTVLAAATCIALVERAMSSLAAVVFRSEPTVQVAAPLKLRPTRVFHALRSRPLTIHGALRAPPLSA